jgi:hypothetical protein
VGILRATARDPLRPGPALPVLPAVRSGTGGSLCRAARRRCSAALSRRPSAAAPWPPRLKTQMAPSSQAVARWPARGPGRCTSNGHRSRSELYGCEARHGRPVRRGAADQSTDGCREAFSGATFGWQAGGGQDRQWTQCCVSWDSPRRSL